MQETLKPVLVYVKKEEKKSIVPPTILPLRERVNTTPLSLASSNSRLFQRDPYIYDTGW